MFHLGVLALGFATIGMAANAATYTPLALPTPLNTDIRTWTDGSAYNPLFPSSSQTLGGVPFNFQADVNGNTAFGGLGGSGSITIPAGVNDVSSVYTLINTAFGAYGADVGSVTFNGSLGSYTVELIEGLNVRDHYYGGFVNTTTDPTTTEAVWGNPNPGNAHLDMQDFILPAAFAGETLDDIVFTDYGFGGDGEPFIAGATALSGPVGVPDGGLTAGLLGGALAGLGALRRKLSV